MEFNSEQEIFEYVIKFLIKQGVQSLSLKNDDIHVASVCKYRLGNLKCAAGCLIPDEFYKSEMEDLIITTLAERFLLPDYILNNISIISELQYFHDNDENWNSEGLIIKQIKHFATIFDLNSDFLNAA